MAIGSHRHCYSEVPRFHQVTLAPKTISNEEFDRRIGQIPVDLLIRGWKCRIRHTLKSASFSENQGELMYIVSKPTAMTHRCAWCAMLKVMICANHIEKKNTSYATKPSSLTRETNVIIQARGEDHAKIMRAPLLSFFLINNLETLSPRVPSLSLYLPLLGLYFLCHRKKWTFLLRCSLRAFYCNRRTGIFRVH